MNSISITCHRSLVLAACLLGGFVLLACARLEAIAVQAPALSEFQTNWPRFRGWDGSGVSTPTNPPTSSGAANGTAILWRSAIPAPGHSSPVVWGDRVFITGTAAKREVFCYHAVTGALLWQRAIENVPGSPAKMAEDPKDAIGAAPSTATDGRHIFALFANGDLAALNFEGAIVWSKSLGPMKNSYGFATSLAIWRSQLLIQLDQGTTPKTASSKLICLEGASGQTLWERNRPVLESWSTPIVVEAAGKVQIITLSDPWVIAYSASGGDELWRAQVLESEVVPSAVFAGGLVIVIKPGARLMALRPDGTGDVTKTHVAWATEENVPDITSPVAMAGLVFTVTSSGSVTCFEANDGKKIWEKNLELGVQASPGIMGERLFVLGEEGALVVLQAGRQFHELGRSQLPDKFLASPAFANGRMFLRGMTNLYSLDLLNASRQRGAQ